MDEVKVERNDDGDRQRNITLGCAALVGFAITIAVLVPVGIWLWKLALG